MGKAHRDNHRARRKAVTRGVDAFEKKRRRRAAASRERARCAVCGSGTPTVRCPHPPEHRNC